MGTLSRWITAIGAAFKRPAEHSLPPTSPALPVTDENRVEGAVAEDAVVADEAAATVEVEDAAATVESEDVIESEDVAATVEAEDAVATVEPEAATVESDDEAATVEVEAEDEAVPAQAERSQETPIVITSGISPDQQEIQRRRELVRTLFNDFWKGNDEKPATFADRLNQAEGYLNERLIERGESWQLDTATRKMLGLPPRAN